MEGQLGFQSNLHNNGGGDVVCSVFPLCPVSVSVSMSVEK